MPFPVLPIATEIIGGGLDYIQGQEQEREAKRLEAKAQTVKPPMEDVNERSFLNDLQRKRRAIATGTAYQSQAGDIGEQLASTQTGIVRASGGAGGAAIAGLSRAQRSAGQQLSTIANQGQQQELAYTGMANALNSRIAARRFELQNQEYNTLLGQSAQSKLSGQYNKNAGISSIIGGIATAGQSAIDNIPQRRLPSSTDLNAAVKFTPMMPDPNEEYNG